MIKIFFLINLLLCFFISNGWAPPPGKAGAPPRIEMPKDQPGYSNLDKASKGESLYCGICCENRICRRCCVSKPTELKKNEICFLNSGVRINPSDNKYCGCCGKLGERCVPCCVSRPEQFKSGKITVPEIPVGIK